MINFQGANKLTSLQGALLRANTRLVSLGLRRNGITGIQANFFDNLSNLRFVNLQTNECVNGFYSIARTVAADLAPFLDECFRNYWKLKREFLSCKLFQNNEHQWRSDINKNVEMRHCMKLTVTLSLSGTTNISDTHANNRRSFEGIYFIEMCKCHATLQKGNRKFYGISPRSEMTHKSQQRQQLQLFFNQTLIDSLFMLNVLVLLPVMIIDTTSCFFRDMGMKFALHARFGNLIKRFRLLGEISCQHSM